jgi:hypothetical protein
MNTLQKDFRNFTMAEVAVVSMLPPILENSCSHVDRYIQREREREGET